jgi:dolichyl-phosphate-mannose--protein O-mannosyl transferase
VRLTQAIRRPAVLVPAAIMLLSAGIRLYGLGDTQMFIGDELYYVVDAARDTDTTIVYTDIYDFEIKDNERSWMHPPAGKLIIGAGIKGFGLNAFGWRISAAVFGVLGIVFVYLTGMAVWRSVWWAGLAALLLSVDGLHIVHSRMAMLDIYETTFISAGILCLAMTWRRRLAPAPEPVRSDSIASRAAPLPWWLAAGAALGLAGACKWSAYFLLVPVAVALGLAALVSNSGWYGRVAGLGRVALAFVLLPVVIYIATYGHFFAIHGPDAAGFIQRQREMADFHQTFANPHVQGSQGLTWPLLIRPFYYEHVVIGQPAAQLTQDVQGLGNPVLWWGWLAVAPVLVWSVLRRRNLVNAAILGAYAALWTPWLLVSRPQFLWYMLPCVPIMALGVAAGLRSVGGRTATGLGIAWAIGATVAAVVFAPVWLGIAVPVAWSDHLHWLGAWQFPPSGPSDTH